MSQINHQLSTGLPGLDRALHGLILGDNIVWQFDALPDYARFIQPYRESAHQRGRRLVYFRFAEHEPLLSEGDGVDVHRLDPRAGFEEFVAAIHEVIEHSEPGTWYVFDCLTDLALAWHSDTMLGCFFVLTCPYLYDVDAIAYFGLLRHTHAAEATQAILSTTQVFLDVYRHKENVYVHPIKVQQRKSPTMYMLHVWKEHDFLPVTDSATTAEILSTALKSSEGMGISRQGVWHGAFRRAWEARRWLDRKAAGEREIEEALDHLLHTAITREPRMIALWKRYFTIDDVLDLGRRIIGTGLIGGKAVGMLLARAILHRAESRWEEQLEVHDSFYIGSDVFYQFLVHNGLWWMWQKPRTQEQLLHEAELARRRIVLGEFPEPIRAQFQAMLHYFGQSPIIVRSSSLLEDSFHHSFSGKYESVFLANQGSPEQRLEDFIGAVRTVYASTMSQGALTYRARRGMLGRDEQMALLVQRVSGAVHDRLFFPHLGGVGFSYNPYVWSEKIDPRAGVLRLVFGLGTRAVDRTEDDYPRVVALNAPERQPVSNYDDMLQYSQRRVDVLDLVANQLITERFEEVLRQAPELPVELFLARDQRQRGYTPEGEAPATMPRALTFEQLLRHKDTPYVAMMRRMLAQIEEAYGCPVDVEFTTNVTEDDRFVVNLVQCRPLQIQIEGDCETPPSDIAPEHVLLEASGAIVGHSRILPVDRIIYVVPSAYGQLPLRDRYSIARLVGQLVPRAGDRQEENVMLLGPGRWGTSMPTLGVPVNFDEISGVSILSEIVAMRENLVPDVSLGTHFLNELVEADILYFALFPDRDGNTLDHDFFENGPNALAELVDGAGKWQSVVRVIDASSPNDAGRVIFYANTPRQQIVCFRD